MDVVRASGGENYMGKGQEAGMSLCLSEDSEEGELLAGLNEAGEQGMEMPSWKWESLVYRTHLGICISMYTQT